MMFSLPSFALFGTSLGIDIATDVFILSFSVVVLFRSCYVHLSSYIVHPTLLACYHILLHHYNLIILLYCRPPLVFVMSCGHLPV
ncbi:hypothetical protein GGU10DRAFT_338049 [Lentinula aff. detonsa]|uniref:Uncharacterized protein n=1 Tax=Lentinula aff. detonsa TaxID=2804958 RepID=A0AA38U8H6_9AGAR|nr:hypothetical protein GGU10DRAFT_338049 [Lentinula aff. detonsa]